MPAPSHVESLPRSANNPGKYPRKLTRSLIQASSEQLDAERAEAARERLLAEPDHADRKSLDRARVKALLADIEARWSEMTEAQIASRMLTIGIIASRNAGHHARLPRLGAASFADVFDAYRLMLRGRASWRDVLVYTIDVALAHGAELDPCLGLLPELQDGD